MAPKNLERRRALLSGAAGGALAIVAIAALVLAAQGIVAGLIAREGAPAPAQLTAVVELGAVTESVEGSLLVEPTFEVGIPRIVPAGGEGVFTRAGISAGSEASEGDVIATIAERPIFVLSGGVPAYRALAPGSLGSDVAQLQDGLARLGFGSSDLSGTYGRSTARAVFGYYSSKGYPAVNTAGDSLTPSQAVQASVPLGELRFMAATPAIADSDCGHPGDQASAVICTLSGGGVMPFVEFASADSVRVQPGQLLKVNLSSGQTLDGELGAEVVAPTTVDDSTDASESSGSTAATRVRFSISVTDPASLAAGAVGRVSVTIKASTAEDLRVIAIAIRDETGGAQLKTETASLDVEVGLCADGYCEVSGSGIAAGLEVLLPNPLLSLEDQQP